jgi:hypothetical protein
VIVQHPFQINQQIKSNGPNGGQNDTIIRVPKDAVGWRIRPNAFGLANMPQTMQSAITLAELKAASVAGRFPIQLSLDNVGWTLDTAGWQRTKAGRILVSTDAFIQAAISDCRPASTAVVAVSDNWILESCDEEIDLYCQAPEKFKTVPILGDYEILLTNVPKLVAGPFMGDEAEVTVQNLGTNACWFVVCGAYGGVQFSPPLPDPATKGQLVAPSGAYIFKHLPPGAGIFADCPGGNQVAGAGTRVIVVDR